MPFVASVFFTYDQTIILCTDGRYGLQENGIWV